MSSDIYISFNRCHYCAQDGLRFNEERDYDYSQYQNNPTYCNRHPRSISKEPKRQSTCSNHDRPLLTVGKSCTNCWDYCVANCDHFLWSFGDIFWILIVCCAWPQTMVGNMLFRTPCLWLWLKSRPLGPIIHRQMEILNPLIEHFLADYQTMWPNNEKNGSIQTTTTKCLNNQGYKAKMSLSIEYNNPMRSKVKINEWGIKWTLNWHEIWRRPWRYSN